MFKATLVFLLKYVVGPFAGTIVGRALLEVCHAFDWWPDKLVAGLIMTAVTDADISLIGWLLSAATGILLYAVAYYFLFLKKHTDAQLTSPKLTREMSFFDTPNFAVERRQIAEKEIATLTADELFALRHMLITGRPKNLSERIWKSLEMKTSLVERDFTGPKGIKNEFRHVLEEVLGSNREPVILAELETAGAPIGDLTPACAIRVTNTGPELKEKCLAQIEDHGLKMQLPDPFVIRTEGQIRDNRTGRFTLSAGQPKLIPILFRVPANLGQFRFIGEDGKNYDFVGESAEFVVAIYGADNPTRVRIRLDGGQDFNPNFELGYC